MLQTIKTERSDEVQSAQATTQWEIPKRTVSTDDPLLKCLVLVTRFYNRPYSEETLSAGLPLVDSKLTPALFERAADRAGLAAKVVARDLDKLSRLVLPVVVLMSEGRACILRSITPQGACQIVEPDTGGVAEIALA